MLHWYLIFTKPHKETLVVRQLEDRGFEVFFPTLQFERGYNRGIRLEPYFPHYLFARIDLQSGRTGDLRWLAGVRTIVHFGGGPAIVPDAVVETLRQSLAAIYAQGAAQERVALQARPARADYRRAICWSGSRFSEGVEGFGASADAFAGPGILDPHRNELSRSEACVVALAGIHWRHCQCGFSLAVGFQ